MLIEDQQTLQLPYFNSPFSLYTDESDKGIAGVLIQQNKIIRLYSSKLTNTQSLYTVVEKEALAIILSLQEFKSIVWTNKIHIHTDNKNFTFDSLSSGSRSQRWKLILSEFDYTMNHVAGKLNNAADYLSRSFTISNKKTNSNKLPKHQNSQRTTQLTTYTNNNTNKLLSNANITIPSLPIDSNNRIIIPPPSEQEFLTSSHSFLGHPGMNKIYSTLVKFFSIPQMKNKINHLIHICLDCQRNKHHAAKTGTLSGYIRSDGPLEAISSDIFGPIQLENFQGIGKIYLLTITDIFSRFSRVVLLDSPTGAEVARLIHLEWIKIFEKPKSILTDQGPQYTSNSFQKFLKDKNIHHRFSTAYNPTGNSLSERINLAIAQILRSVQGRRITELLQEIESSLNRTVNRTLGFSPEEILNGKSSLDPLQRDLEIDMESVKQRANAFH